MLLASETMDSFVNGSQTKLDRFLVCGLGSLGQHCVVALKAFGASFSAIEQVQPRSWEFPNLPDLLEDLIIGDCLQPSLLEQAKIRQCRAILLVTGNERVNIETAFAARLLNPQIRLIVRSGKQNLNQLLEKNLGNFVAFDANQLPAEAFALAGVGDGTLGCFYLEKQWWRVLSREVEPSDRWCCDRLVHQINSRTRRVLSHAAFDESLPQEFYGWEPETKVVESDTLIYIEAVPALTNPSGQPPVPSQSKLRQFLASLSSKSWQDFWDGMLEFWQSKAHSQTRRTAALSAIAVLALLAVGTVLFKWNYPDKTRFQDALNLTVVLLLGGFDNVFGALNLPFPISWWLYLFCIGLTVAGTIFVGILYAMLTEKVLASKFQLLRRRPPVPEQDHVVLIGLDGIGQQVASWLQEFQQPLVAITPKQVPPDLLPKMPLIAGEVAQVLGKANLSKAKSVIVASDDEMVNLEVGLMAHAANPAINLVLRTFAQRFSDHVAQLFPYSQVLCAYVLVAEAFVGAAYGEIIINLFRLNNQTVLVTEYNIEDIDTLHGLLLAEVAYGYGVVPIVHHKNTGESPHLMPSDDTRLQVGDRLVVLATIEGLRRIEHGELAPRRWQVRLENAASESAMFEGANVLSRISGCSMGVARNLMQNLPVMLPEPLYKHQAQRLARHLSKIQVMARVVSLK